MIRKIVEIELDEIEDLQDCCRRIYTMVEEVQKRLKEIDLLTCEVEEWLNIMEFRVINAKEIDEYED